MDQGDLRDLTVLNISIAYKNAKGYGYCFNKF